MTLVLLHRTSQQLVQVLEVLALLTPLYVPSSSSLSLVLPWRRAAAEAGVEWAESVGRRGKRPAFLTARTEGATATVMGKNAKYPIIGQYFTAFSTICDRILYRKFSSPIC